VLRPVPLMRSSATLASASAAAVPFLRSCAQLRFASSVFGVSCSGLFLAVLDFIQPDVLPFVRSCGYLGFQFAVFGVPCAELLLAASDLVHLDVVPFPRSFAYFGFSVRSRAASSESCFPTLGYNHLDVLMSLMSSAILGFSFATLDLSHPGSPLSLRSLIRLGPLPL
jgi:hypothetical protein